jgi:uncharacterized phiE125 gp8 family phage protein
MDWIISTQPTTEPVSLTEMKLHLKVQSGVTTDDSLISTLITAAREWCEQYQNRAYVSQTITLKLDTFQDVIYLPAPPLISVTNVKYLDANEAEQTLATSVYDVFTTPEPGEIRLAYGQTWPIIYDVRHAVRVTYLAGYTQATSGKTIAGATKANPCVITAASHGFTTGQSVYIADIVDSGTAGDFSEALNNQTFPITWTHANTFSVPVDTSGKTYAYASAGTATATTKVPSAVKAAIKLLVGHLYEHREAVTDLNLNEVPMAVKALLSINRNF